MKWLRSKKDKKKNVDNKAANNAAQPADGGQSHSGKQETVDDSGMISKFRRRLTVSGASQNIDGEAAPPGSTNKDTGLLAKNIAVEGDLNQVVHTYAGISKKGFAPYNPRKKNQDGMFMCFDEKTNSLVLCVLDGHGEHGEKVSEHFVNVLPGRLFGMEAWKNYDTIKEAIQDAILSVEDEVLKASRIDTEFSGTTLTMAVIRDGKLLCANIGDSRAVVARFSSNEVNEEGEPDPCYIAEAFTVDHKPDLPEERQRIIDAGGRVFSVEYDDGVDGPPRVWLGHMDVPGLAMARSLGDTVAHTVGVISQPEFTERELNPNEDKFIVIATDGLWEFVENEESVDMVLDVMTKGPCAAAKALVEEANTRWIREEQVVDDTSVIVANLFSFGRKVQ